MKVLVTGANGLVGSYVLKDLIKERYSVQVLLRRNSDRRFIKEYLTECEIIQVDILD